MAPIGGWRGRWDEADDWDHIYIVNTALNSVLKQLNQHPPEVIQSWVSRGYLRCNANSTTKPTRINGEITRCYAIKREVVDLHMYDR